MSENVHTTPLQEKNMHIYKGGITKIKQHTSDKTILGAKCQNVEKKKMPERGGDVADNYQNSHYYNCILIRARHSPVEEDASKHHMKVWS